MRESKRGEQPRGKTAPLKRDRATAAAREKQRNEQKVERLASNNKIQLSFVIAIVVFFSKLGFEPYSHVISYVCENAV